MTYIYGDDKPSLEDIEHHGVKGQKWGTKRGKPSSGQILDARARLGSQRRQINSQIDKTNLASGKTQEKEAKTLVKLTTAHLNNPDRATALRMTKGEKFVAGLAAVVLPGVGTAGVAVGVGARVHTRHKIERNQKLGTT